MSYRYRRLLATLSVWGALSLAAGCEGSVSSRARGDQPPDSVRDAGRPATTGAAGSARQDGSAGPDNDASAGGDAGPPAEAASTNAINVRFFSLVNQQVGTRFAQLPSVLPVVRLLPSITLLSAVAATVGSVRFTVDGVARVDAAAP